MNWHLVKPTDIRARLLADRHYNRQTPGATEFCPPGNKVVLIIPGSHRTALAVWASQRPAPESGIGRADGMEWWHNPIFRNESGLRSSDLILEALAITRYFWHELPADGFHTFVDPAKVRGVKVRGQLIQGYSFMRAGFELWPELTQSRKLLRWVLSVDKLAMIEPVAPCYEQMRMAI